MREYWSRAKASEIVHGLTLDTELITKYLPRVERDPSRTDLWPWFYNIYELGAGGGELARKMVAVGHFLVSAIDINPLIEQLKKPISPEYPKTLSLDGRAGDVTSWSQGIGRDSVLHLERIDAVIAQSVMPSLLGDGGKEWEKMLDAAAMWIAPNKYLFLHDFRAADYYYSPIAKVIGPKEWQEQMYIWHERYRRNQEAFAHLRIPKRAFAVGKPGTDGKILELGSVSELKELFSREDCFERFAQHVDPIEVNLHMRRLGFTLVEEKYDFYQSRGNRELLTPQVMQVWKKGSVFQYDPITRGLDISDPSWEQVALERYHKKKELCESLNLKYFWTTLDEVAKYAPHSQLQSILHLRDQF